MGWREAVSEGIYRALCAALGYNPEGNGLKRFIPAYVNNTITPQAPRDVDVCYFDVRAYEGQDSGLNYIMQNQVVVNGQPKTKIMKSVPVTVLVTFYGPNADNDSEEFWSMFQWDNGKESPRAILRSRRIVPIGRPYRPTPLYEVEGTYQRRRCDVRVHLAYLDVGEKNSSHIDTVPEIGFQVQT